MSDWTITRLAPALGAEVDGLDLATATDDELAALHGLLDDHQVLVLPGQAGLSAAEHVRVAETFGDPYLHPFLEAVPEHPAILQVLKEPTDTETFGGEFWHCDISFTDPPAAASVLHGIDIPPSGGDTLFADTVGALERLSSPIRTMLGSLTATHVYPDMVEGPETSAVHPVVRLHPRTGRHSLYVNPAFVDRINELERVESDALLTFLYQHQTRPEFQVRIGWKPGQVVIWDNRTTIHYALNDYPGQRRRLQRVTPLERPT